MLRLRVTEKHELRASMGYTLRNQGGIDKDMQVLLQWLTSSKSAHSQSTTLHRVVTTAKRRSKHIIRTDIFSSTLRGTHNDGKVFEILV